MLAATIRFKVGQTGFTCARQYDVGVSTPAPGTHRFDVTVQEANRVDALNGLQDLAAQAQSCADAEGPAGHAPPQVSQVATLTRRKTQRTAVFSGWLRLFELR